MTYIVVVSIIVAVLLGTAVFKSLGALTHAERDLVNMSNYTQTVDALGLDGVAPDTSIVVDGGNGSTLFCHILRAPGASVGGAAFRKCCTHNVRRSDLAFSNSNRGSSHVAW